MRICKQLQYYTVATLSGSCEGARFTNEGITDYSHEYVYIVVQVLVKPTNWMVGT